jgi:hypothetical protein
VSAGYRPFGTDDEDSFERDQHCAFAHRKVRWLFGEDPAASVFSMSFMDKDWLRALWFGDDLPWQADPLAAVGLACENLTYPGTGLTVVLFTMPKPWFTTGAHFVAATLLRRHGAGQSDVFGYWRLEKTVGDGSEEAAILGGWREGCHVNMGRVGTINREGFLEAVVARMDPALAGTLPVTDLRVEI